MASLVTEPAVSVARPIGSYPVDTDLTTYAESEVPSQSVCFHCLPTVVCVGLAQCGLRCGAWSCKDHSQIIDSNNQCFQ
eukprot:184003-Amphidinium_carterae.1